ncbi:MAG: hypothetical protein KF832_16115 [Caldilineaceae bacterium]|nr:hypothetical protein [Caldilineaceae bacterium]
MCTQFTILVEQGEWHYVARCEHGTLHLRWGHITIALGAADFRTFARLALTEAANHQPASGRMRLQVDTVTVEFPAADLYPLLALMQRALTHLDTEEPPLYAPQTRISSFPLTNYMN